MKQDLVSVIVPVYNTEKYLCDSIESILNQTYKNIEVIIINDGSTDESGNICDELAKKDKRIKTIHQKNQGSGVARNTGLAMINGKYIMFVDSDDIIKNDMIKQMVDSIERHDSDLVAVGLQFVEENKDIELNKIENEKEPSLIDKDSLAQGMLDGKYPVSIVNKIYRTSIVRNNDIRFQENYRFWEDLDFNISYLEKTNKRIVVLENSYYFAIMRKGSQTRQNDNYKDYELVRSTQYIYNMLNDRESWSDTVKKQAGSLLANVLITFYYHGGVFPETDRENTRRKILNEIDILECTLILKKRVQYIIMKHFPFLEKALEKCH